MTAKKTDLEISQPNNFGCPNVDGVVAMVVLVLSSGDIFGGQGPAKSWPVPDTK